MKNKVIVCENLNIFVADTFFKKLIGLSFKKKKIDYGLIFKNTNGIHTFFMFQNIDVILLDKDYNVLDLIENIKPWRVLLPKIGVHHTLEVPCNTGHIVIEYLKSKKTYLKKVL